MSLETAGLISKHEPESITKSSSACAGERSRVFHLEPDHASGHGEEHYRLNWPGGREIREDHPSVKLYGYVLFASGEGVYRVNTLMRDDACAG